MSKDLTIIDRLADTISRRIPGLAQLAASESKVIDLDARRQAAKPADRVAPTEAQPDQVSADDVRAALDEGRFVVHYQPQYDMQNGSAVAAEALVRLEDLDGQLVYPDRFISQIEERDVIVPLGRAVIERVCADLATCRAEGLDLRRVAVNLSAHQLTADTSLLSFVDATVANFGLRNTDLEFELTERHGLGAHCTGHEILNGLAQRGSRIVIDDFGVGYSSVVYLAELPVAAFKLDRSLVQRVLTDSTARTLVESLLILADNMGLDVIAEGVETKAQSNFLDAAGCPLAQGYGYARPMPVDNLKQFIKRTDTAFDRLGVGA